MSGPSFVHSTFGDPAVPTYLALAGLPVRLGHTDNQFPALKQAYRVGWSLQPYFNRLGLLGNEDGVPWVTSRGEEGNTCILYAKQALGLLTPEALDEESSDDPQRKNKLYIPLRSLKNRSTGPLADPRTWTLADSEPTDRFVPRINAGLSEALRESRVVTNARDEQLRALVLVLSAPVLLQIKEQALYGKEYFRGTRWELLEDLSASGQLTVLRWQPPS